MYINFKGSKIFYEIEGDGSAFITLLCGWGYGCELLKPFGNYLKDYRKLYIDFPCFGKSENVACDWKLEDYCSLVKTILDKEKIESTKIIAHSFGGKVAILLASEYNVVESLVLIASAGIKPKFSLKTRVKIWHFKIAKMCGKNTDNFGSEDFKNLPKLAQKTFVNIVNTHIEEFCSDVNCKTLIIAGKQDDATPLYMQKKLHSKIKRSNLLVFNASHYVWTANFSQIMNEIKKFFKEREYDTC